MGTFRQRIDLAAGAQGPFESVEALVDTGATYTSAPGPMLRRLGVEPIDTETFVLADGSQVERPVGEAAVRLDGRVRTTMVIFGEEASTPLLGAITLEAFSLAADMRDGSLIRVPAHLGSRLSVADDRFVLMDGTSIDVVDGKLQRREGQTLEYKASLAEEQDGIRAMVAFANTQGGQVLFGVKDDGTVVGTDIGANSLEGLAPTIRDHTYPSLPVSSVEQLRLADKDVVVVEVPADTPPVVGVYLYSSRRLDSNKPVDASEVQAYRRVGRVNQKEDFMRLRTYQPSDPRVRLTGVSSYNKDPETIVVRGRMWVEDGSGSAHRIDLHSEPGTCECEKTIADLPYPVWSSIETPGARFYGERTVREVVAQEAFELFCNIPWHTLPVEIKLCATYMDDYGATWRSSRTVRIFVERASNGREVVESADLGAFQRRIVRFPPKVAAA